MASRKSLICLIVSLFVIWYLLSPKGATDFLVHLILLSKVVENLEHVEMEAIFGIVCIFVLIFVIVVKAIQFENSNVQKLRKPRKLWQERIQALLKVNQEFGQILLDHYNEDPNYSPFYSAVKSADMEFIRSLLQLNILRHEDFYEVDSCGNTSFHHAFKNEDYEIVNLLLDYSSKYNFSSVFYITNKDGLTPLDYAIGKGHLDIVKLALQTDDFDLNKYNQIKWVKLFYGSSSSKAKELMQEWKCKD